MIGQGVGVAEGGYLPISVTLIDSLQSNASYQHGVNRRVDYSMYVWELVSAAKVTLKVWTPLSGKNAID